MRADGAKRHGVTRREYGQDDTEPAFSPSGKRIAFERFFYRGPIREHKSRIYITKTNGSRLHKLKSRRRPRLRHYHNPAFSPNGRRIAFEGCRRADDRPHLRCALFTIRTNGTRQRRLTDYRARYQGVDRNPTFSPNGRRIAFDGDPSGGTNARSIYVMKADGTDLRALTNNGSNVNPSFSPDGSQIAFARDRPGGAGWQIYVMRAHGSGVRQLTFPEDPDDPAEPQSFSPSFSPNGRRIAFTIFEESLIVGNRSWIAVMRADGIGQRRLGFGEQPDWAVRR